VEAGPKQFMPSALFFPYFGPNRRSDRKVVELRLDFGPDEEIRIPRQLADTRQLLEQTGILASEQPFPESPLPEEPAAGYASLLAQTALLLQQKNGHRVDFHSVSFNPDKARCTVQVEHEHPDVGMAAVKLAVDWFANGNAWTQAVYQGFAEFARDRVLPLETQAIIRAAERRNIPWLHLEREPLTGKLNTGVRVRPNGLIRIGHGAAGGILDGTFCVDRADNYQRALLRNPGLRAELLRELGAPVAPDQRAGSTAVQAFQLLVAKQQVTAIAEADGQLVNDVHESVKALGLAISERLGGAPVVVHLRAPDLVRPLEESAGAAVDFELGPDLQRILVKCADGPALLDAVAGDLLDWLVPDPAAARMPIVAITGTNGKTTTSRMISQIMKQAGRKPGLVCTDGIFLDEKLVSPGDGSAFIGHARVLSSKQVDVAVLEAHHRGIAVRGFAFADCDVAVCLNVTRDHLAEGEIETVEEMAEIKRALLERARKGAVLNADDPACQDMLGHLAAARICWFSSSQDRRALSGQFGDQVLACLLEPRQDGPWVVIHDAAEQHDVMPVSAMPSSFDGAARFNVENALAAIAVCHLMGVSLPDIRAAMQSFAMSFERTPGRLNCYHDLPFRAVVDFAHNPNGVARLAEFARDLPISGRRLILLAGPGSSSDEVIADMARAAAGQFDHYVCRSYPNTRGRAPEEVPRILHAALTGAGVPETSITTEPDAAAAAARILDMAQPSDLVVLQLSRREFAPANTHLLALRAKAKQG
jgi:UDP-N-acetylmuramyl tripeptide synthase